MPESRYEEVRRSIEGLQTSEQLKLLAELTARLSPADEGRARSVLELQGLGKEIWRDIDVDDYIDRERSSWNG